MAATITWKINQMQRTTADGGVTEVRWECSGVDGDARAVEAGKGCPIFLKKTHENTLKILPIETLKKFAIDLS